MAKLEYSNEALSVKGLFYNKSITVYVEGKDDPLFWDKLFNLAEISAHIEDVGGKEELDKYFNKIIEEKADFYIATDNDNSEFMDDTVNHPNIIRSYGYSIENSMYYHSDPIEKLVSDFCRKKLNFSEDFKHWIQDFSQSVYDLIIYDIANNKYKKGISIFGDNCYKFLPNQNAHNLCSTKTNQFIDSIKVNFTEDEIFEVKQLINQSEKDLWFFIKGHFITHALINMIKYSIRKHSGVTKGVTPDFLYSITVDCRQDWENRIDILYLVERIKQIKSTA
ncbi:DUF4435 domain-containing protein [Flavobacterium sp. SM15]|uniref:DUF4435 domain-containing protein n=1 Tax=Flavobacterium sp. SM15 TaxID=2908005 RepID=UPI001EDBF387|nr:DUF4435 domain-containing protein [Flavobacterium sp. SM15]MCG2611897.1 DUF4435 domain-containing protein [Flavobacterium sp. SM15]